MSAPLSVVSEFFAPVVAAEPAYDYIFEVRRVFSVYIGLGVGLQNAPTDTYTANGFTFPPPGGASGRPMRRLTGNTGSAWGGLRVPGLRGFLRGW